MCTRMGLHKDHASTHASIHFNMFAYVVYACGGEIIYCDRRMSDKCLEMNLLSTTYLDVRE